MSGDPGAHAYRNVIITAATAGLAGLLFGYDTGVIAGALLQITPDFGLTSLGSGVICRSAPADHPRLRPDQPRIGGDLPERSCRSPPTSA